MFIVIGLVVVMIMVFGGYILSGGKFAIIIKALPYELMIIFGGSLGAFVMANSTGILTKSFKGILKAASGAKWKAQDYRDILCLMFVLTKTMRQKGVIAVESHIDKPDDSKIFQHFPKVAADHHLVHFICDYIRMMTMNFEDPNQMEDAMDREIEKHAKEEHEPQHSLQTMADGMPAVGIVAAVLGIIKTMGSINEPVEVLGRLVGGALVGTFLGIFLSYLLVAPIAGRFNQVLTEEHSVFEIIKAMMVSHLQGNAPQITAEIGRRQVPSHMMPSFEEMEEAINELPPDLI